MVFDFLKQKRVFQEPTQEELNQKVLKEEKNTSNKNINKPNPFVTGRNIGSAVRDLSNIRQPDLSNEQRVMQEIMSGGSINQCWGTGENLPRLNRTLSSGGGILKSGDGGETGRMFGI